MNTEEHSIYGASGAKCWRNCPGAPLAVKQAQEEGKIRKGESTTYADEGTEAHNWAEMVLSGNVDMDDIPDEFRIHLNGYIAFCDELMEIASAGGETYVEHKVPLFYRPQDRGTLDFATVTEEQLDFVDLKYGAGVKVDAMDNDQLAIYLLSFVQELEVMEGWDFTNETVCNLSIYQPRHFSFDGEPETWTISLGELKAMKPQIETDYNLARSGEGQLVPSDAACQFCDVKAICEARAATSFGGLPAALNVMEDFDDETGEKEAPPTAKEFKKSHHGTLTKGQIAWICEHGSTISKIINDVIKFETERLKEGGEIHGMKLVEGKQGNRAWVDERAAETFLRGLLGAKDAFHAPKLISAPQALAKTKPMIKEMSTISKLKLGLVDAETAAKSKTQSLIHRPEGKPLLVPVSDNREALDFNPVENDFDNEEIENGQ